MTVTIWNVCTAGERELLEPAMSDPVSTQSSQNFGRHKNSTENHRE
jgi:hypothetical protein